jgi:hypothetical protein
MLQQTPGPRYYACKQFFRYIRPDAVMVDAACDDSTVLATAFVHSGDRTMAVVLVNPTGEPRNLALAVEGAAMRSFTQVRSSRSETCDTVGTVTNSVVLPPLSITTLYAEGVTTSVRISHAVRKAAPVHGRTGRFDLRGRRVTGTHRTLACTIVENVNGAAVSLGLLVGRKQR